jgi:hypothetical protein
VTDKPESLALGLGHGGAASGQVASFQIPVDYCKGVVRMNFYISADEVDAPGFGTFARDSRGPVARSTAWDSRASFELDFQRGVGRLFVNYTCGARSGMLRDQDYTCHDALPIGIGTVNTTTPVTNSGFSELDVRRRDGETELELRWKLPNPPARVMGISPCAITGQATFDYGAEGTGLRLEDKVFRNFPSTEIYQFAGTRTITHENRVEGNPLDLCALR